MRKRKILRKVFSGKINQAKGDDQMKHFNMEEFANGELSRQSEELEKHHITVIA